MYKLYSTLQNFKCLVLFFKSLPSDKLIFFPLNMMGHPETHLVVFALFSRNRESFMEQMLHAFFQVTSLDSEAIIRQGISRFTDQRGTLWCALADYYIRAGLFDRAR